MRMVASGKNVVGKSNNVKNLWPHHIRLEGFRFLFLFLALSQSGAFSFVFIATVAVRSLRKVENTNDNKHVEDVLYGP